VAELLITGGAGFIGANFTRYWRQAHPLDGLTVLDALTYAGNPASLEGIPDVSFIHGDIRDYELVKRLLEERAIDTLVHFAAETHVDRSIHGPDALSARTSSARTSCSRPPRRSGWTAALKSRTVSIMSRRTRFSVLSGRSIQPFSETTAYRPNSPYSASKAASDHLVRAYHRTFGLQATASNCSNNYGPYQFPEKLIPLFVINVLQGRPLPIYGDGLNVRSWLYVEDHCRGLDLVVRQGRVGEHTTSRWQGISEPGHHRPHLR